MFRMISFGPISVLLIVVAATCLGFAILNFAAWWRRNDSKVFLAFSLSSLGVAVYAVFEVILMRTYSPEFMGELVRWGHIPAAVGLICYAWFIRLHLRIEYLWLFWLIVSGRILQVIVNFIVSPNINYIEISSVREIVFLGESIADPLGTPNPLMLIGQLSSLLLVVYIGLGLGSEWRRGAGAHFAATGIAASIFAFGFLGVAIISFWDLAQIPLVASPFFAGMVAVMGFQLASEAARASEFEEMVQKSIDELEVARAMANLSGRVAFVAVLIRELYGETYWASDSFYEMFGFEKRVRLERGTLLARIHPEDLEAVTRIRDAALEDRVGRNVEYRIILPDGSSKWIRSYMGIMTEDGSEKFAVASIDVTEIKQSEEAAHSLSGRLIEAQEAERSRLARELHDDLSQRLALISIRLELLGQLDGDKGSKRRSDTEDLIAQVRSVSIDIHRMSHELHPSKLEQLGLVASVRGICREIAEAYKIEVATDLERFDTTVDADVALSLYRITQESLGNVVKHSGAKEAIVRLSNEGTEVTLSVSDNGCGFEMNGTPKTNSLGLVSMQERAHLVHGRLTVRSEKGKGTVVEVKAPARNLGPAAA